MRMIELRVTRCLDYKILSLNDSYLQTSSEEIGVDDYAMLYGHLQKEFRELCRAHQLLQSRLGSKSVQGKFS